MEVALNHYIVDPSDENLHVAVVTSHNELYPVAYTRVYINSYEALLHQSRNRVMNSYEWFLFCWLEENFHRTPAPRFSFWNSTFILHEDFTLLLVDSLKINDIWAKIIARVGGNESNCVERYIQYANEKSLYVHPAALISHYQFMLEIIRRNHLRWAIPAIAPLISRVYFGNYSVTEIQHTMLRINYRADNSVPTIDEVVRKMSSIHTSRVAVGGNMAQVTVCDWTQ